MCKRIFLNNSHPNTIFSYTHVIWKCFNFHYSTFWMKWLLPNFSKRLWTKLRPWTFVWFLQVDIPMHVTFICKWSFLNGVWTPSKLTSSRRFHKWIPTVVSTLFSYCTRSHSMSNRTCPWGGLLLNFNKALKWNLSHCYSRNIILTHKPRFMPPILRCCNTFFPSPIQNNNQRWMWSNNGLKHE